MSENAGKYRLEEGGTTFILHRRSQGERSHIVCGGRCVVRKEAISSVDVELIELIPKDEKLSPLTFGLFRVVFVLASGVIKEFDEVLIEVDDQPTHQIKTPLVIT